MKHYFFYRKSENLAANPFSVSDQFKKVRRGDVLGN